MNLNLHLVRPYAKARKKFKGIFYKNPVVGLGLALPFAVVCSNTLQNAAIICIAMLLSFVPTMMLASALNKKIPTAMHFIAYPSAAAILLIPITLLVTPLSANLGDNLGFYLQILAVNSLLIYSVRPCAKMTPKKAAKYALMNWLGFSLVMLCLAFIRELLGSGTLWGVPVLSGSFKLSGLAFPFAGFIMLGFMMAFIRTLNRQMYRLLIHIEINRKEEKRVLDAARSLQ